MIAESSIAKVLETIQIDEVIQEYVPLKKRGANLIGLCPFHNEKTPSFTVSPARGIYKCFGCGAAGNGVKFLMEHEHYTFPEAIEHLAEKYQIDLEYSGRNEEEDTGKDLRESIHIINGFAKSNFIDNLNSEEGRSIALPYLKERGINSASMEKFGIGYALDQYDQLLSKAKDSGFDLQTLADAGLISKDKSKDFFRNRIMFPIHNLSGKVIGFGGRIMQKSSKAPKYINTSESEVYQKSKVLYGMFLARNSIRKEDQCFLVEGYTDVIAMVQAGIDNVVASSGTALTVDQIRLVKRYTSNLTIIYDGDEAGKKAATRGGDIALEEGLNVNILILPEGDDPDSFIRSNGAAAFEEYFASNRVDYILYKTRRAITESEHDPVSKAQLTNEIIQSISKIPDPISRSYYLKECSSILGIQEQILVTESNKVRRGYLSDRSKRIDKEAAEDHIAIPTYKYRSEELEGMDEATYLELLERDLIRLIMEYGPEIIDDEQSVTAYILDELENIPINNPLYKETIEIIANEYQKGHLLPQDFYLHHENTKISELAFELLTSPHEVSENWLKRFEILIPEKIENFHKDIDSSVTRFKLYKLRQMINENKEKLKEATDEESIRKLQEAHLKLHLHKQELAKILGTVVFK